MPTVRHLIRNAVSASGLSNEELLSLLQQEGLLPDTGLSYFKNMLCPTHPIAKLDADLCPMVQKQCGKHHAFFGCAKALGYTVTKIGETSGYMPLSNRFLAINKAQGDLHRAAAENAPVPEIQELAQKVKVAVEEFVNQYAAELEDGAAIRLQKSGEIRVNADRFRKRSLWIRFCQLLKDLFKFR